MIVDAHNDVLLELLMADIRARLWLDGFSAPDDYPALVAALRSRGYDGVRLEAIESGNWLRVLRESLPA